MAKNNILIFDEQGYFYGSTQKLERQVAKTLAKDFNVFFAGGPVTDQKLANELQHEGVKIVAFSFDRKQNREPFKFYGMRPAIMDMVKEHRINCIFTAVYAHYQFPINAVPTSIPFVLISPFGHYCSNGNIAKVYVSGKDNLRRLLKRGVKTAELFYNPLEDFEPEYLKKSPIENQVIFGRIGRGEDSIFDPISLRAFKQLEEKYPDQVKYIVVNPPPAWKKMAQELGVKNIEFRPAISDQVELMKFYQQIDVLAHARKDGETVGMAIAEAMLSGHPILTHKSHFHNDHFDILDTSYAKWSDADDVEGYFENMRWMVEHKDQIREMGALARKRAMEIFSLEAQSAKIIADFKAACARCYHESLFNDIKGYVFLYWENLKAMPFYLGKSITYLLPGAYKSLRKIYYK